MIRITSIDDQAPELVPSYEVSIDPETGASVVTATFYPTDEDLFAEITALSADIQSRQEVVTDTDGRKITVTRYYHVFDRNGTYSFRYEDDLGNIGVAQAEVLGLTTDPARVISAAWYGTRQGTFSNVLPGEQLDIDWNFQAIPQESGQYSRILFKVYDISSGATLGSGQIMQENLLGEGSSYLMCPGSVTKLPVLKFTGASPDTVFTSGIRNFHVTGDNFSMLLDKSAYQLRLSRVDGARIDGRESFAIPADQFQIDDSANVISVILNDENPGTLPEGRYQLTIDYADPDKADLSGTALQFQVSDDEKFRNDTYGFLAVIEDAANGFVYSIRHFLDEEAYWNYLDSGSLDREDVLLELQGLFSKQKTEDGSIVYLGVSNNDSHNVMTLNGTLDIRSGTCTVTELDGSVKVDFDADIYTTGSNTYVHSGVAALTELEKGTDFSLIPYSEDGERSGITGDPIALLWPSVGQAFQNIMGLLFDFRYAELGVMAHANAPSARGSQTRLVGFGAAKHMP